MTTSKNTKYSEAIKYLTLSLISIIVGVMIIYTATRLNITYPASLPKPELSEGQRGQLGIDKNVNESTIDNYLGRSDSVYYDVRMLEDPANYEAIGGDRYLSGLVDGFEVIPLPYLIPATGLPEAVGRSYQGTTLFSPAKVTNSNTIDSTTPTSDSSDTKLAYTPNYAESRQILENLFPKDKYIFLMCGGGGYAGMTKNLLTSLGWDAANIYVVGGYWYYDGEHKVEIKTEQDGKTTYAFWKVPYHNIDFTKLTKI